MNPIRFKGQTGELQKPSSMTDEECAPLPYMRRDDVGPSGAYVSMWQPTPEELQQLNAGGCVSLWVFSSGHPPVGLSVTPVADL